jgi:D-alanyl-D-alanine carboxypeptidase
MNGSLLGRIAALGLLALTLTPSFAAAEASLVIEADTGKVLQAENAGHPWYPASITKIMTTYVTLKAVKEGRLTLDTLLTVSPVAAAQQPSKMGFRSGTQVTVDNALKMMMVKSANDMAVVLAEGVAGSVEGFSEEMNKTAQQLGMTQSHYVNPNGLPADGQVTSARDLGILARAIIRDLPEYEYFVHIPAIRFGRRVTPNFNRLIGRYPGADGMKTGFICASGFNLVASATRDGKRLIAVVLGAQSSYARAARAVQLLEKGFSSAQLSWMRPSLGTVENLAAIPAEPPNLRDEMCGGRRKKPASETDDAVADAGEAGATFFTASLQPHALKPAEVLALPAAPTEPVIVYAGPKKTGTDLIVAVAAETAKQTPKPKPKARAARKPVVAEAKDEPAAKASEASAKPAKPKPKRQAVTVEVKPAAAEAKAAGKKTSAKPAAAPAAAAAAVPHRAKPAAAESKPKAAAKPAAKPGDKPAAAATPRSASSPPG